MEHRHLNHTGFTLAAIDDIISRGNPTKWVELHFAMINESGVRQRVAALCDRHKEDVLAQRYQFCRAHVQFGNMAVSQMSQRGTFLMKSKNP